MISKPVTPVGDAACSLSGRMNVASESATCASPAPLTRAIAAERLFCFIAPRKASAVPSGDDVGPPAHPVRPTTTAATATMATGRNFAREKSIRLNVATGIHLHG